jgi:hypothetical protein
MASFLSNAFTRAREALGRMRRPLSPSDDAETLVELSHLLPTLPRDYFSSFEELPFRAGGDLDLATAWWCAEASMLAYQEVPRIQDLAAPAMAAGWKIEVFGADEPTFAVLLKSDDSAILAFRGTRVSGFERLDHLFSRPWLNYHDLKTDASFAPVPFSPEGAVHGGILQGFDRFWTRHGGRVQRAVDHVPLLLTGHSLGAALATVAGAARRFGSTVAIYSFGSPRVGDGKFRELLKRTGVKAHRFVHGGDLVTTLAPEGWMGFTHVSDVLHLKADGSGMDGEEPDLGGVLLSAMQRTEESLRSAILNLAEHRLMEPQKMLVPRGALADHAPVFYVERIREMAGGRKEA